MQFTWRQLSNTRKWAPLAALLLVTGCVGGQTGDPGESRTGSGCEVRLADASLAAPSFAPRIAFDAWVATGPSHLFNAQLSAADAGAASYQLTLDVTGRARTRGCGETWQLEFTAQLSVTGAQVANGSAWLNTSSLPNAPLGQVVLQGWGTCSLETEANLATLRCR